jgi:nucleoside-diphosphate-sugar epimerase
VITEQTPHQPYASDNYAKSKSEGEHLVSSYNNRGLPVIILRLGALYGPYGHYAFNRIFFEEFLHNWRVEVHNGRHIIFPCFVLDAARAIETALKKGRIGEIYNISNQSISHREANSTVACLAGRSNWRVNVPRWLMLQFVKVLELIAFFSKHEPFYPRNLEPYVFYDWVVDCNKAQRDLLFTPADFSQGAQRTLAWYRSIGYDV